MNPQLLLTWLDDHPRARDHVYTAVLAVAAVLAFLVWVLPFFDVDHIGRIDLAELGKAAILTSAAAAYLAKRNVQSKPNRRAR